MSIRDRYVRNVLENVVAGEEDRQRLAQDLASHFEEGLARGESEAEIARRLGPPEEVAGSFMEGVPLRYAGFWIRVLAFLADIGVACIVTLPFVCVVLVAFPTPGGAAPEHWIAWLFLVPVVLWTVAVFLLYFPILEYRWGKTAAKHILGLRVVNEDGTRLGLGRAFLRRLSFYFEFLVLDALFVPFTERKQRAFDLVAKTVVVRERPEAGASNVLLSLVLAVLLIALPLAVAGLVALAERAVQP